MNALMRGVKSRLPHPWNGRFVFGIPHRIHVSDSMLPSTEPAAVGSYVQAGRSAMEAVRRGLEACGRTPAELGSVLDLGCGYGRVLRFMCREVEPDRITACDLDARAVAFCAAELGVRPLVSRPDLTEVAFESYDLVWSGSLLTHLPERSSDAFLSLLPRILNPGGVAVVSFHGEHSLQALDRLYSGDHAAEAAEIRHEVEDRGFSYRPYGGPSVGYARDADYGMAWHRWDYLERRCALLCDDRLQALAHFPRGWDDHHDVAILRRPEVS